MRTVTKPSAGLSKEKKSEVVKKAKKGGDIGKKGKGFEKLANKAAKEYGSKEKGQKVAAASMWGNIQREGSETKNWVKNLVENEYFHNFTSKGEIMELINNKLTTQTVMEDNPTTAPTKPTTKPGTKPKEPGKKPSHPYGPGRPDKEPNIKPERKAQSMNEDPKVKKNNLPSFLTYDAIKASGENKPSK
mgnify:CR=1 FL=1